MNSLPVSLYQDMQYKVSALVQLQSELFEYCCMIPVNLLTNYSSTTVQSVRDTNTSAAVNSTDRVVDTQICKLKRDTSAARVLPNASSMYWL